MSYDDVYGHVPISVHDIGFFLTVFFSRFLHRPRLLSCFFSFPLFASSIALTTWRQSKCPAVLLESIMTLLTIQCKRTYSVTVLRQTKGVKEDADQRFIIPNQSTKTSGRMAECHRSHRVKETTWARGDSRLCQELTRILLLHSPGCM